jgi:hypothetical protein
MNARWLLLVPGLALFGMVPACEADSPSALPAAEGADCLVNSDCNEPWVCVFQRCHEQCITSRDCDGTLRCVGAHAPAKVCQLESEAATTCRTDADCGKSLKCGVDARCRDSCFADEDCIGEQTCVRGVCAEPSELDEHGELPQKVDLATCRFDLDCEAGQRCAAGNCQPRCRDDRDCSAEQHCAAGACVSSDVVCSTSEDCPLPGSSCQAGACWCECLADVDCATGTVCQDCACRPAPDRECVTTADCTAPWQCVAARCLPQCVTARDCPTGFACEAGGCHVVAEIADASLRDLSDIDAMRGIERVTGRLYIHGDHLDSTQGLEQLTRVGSLEVSGFAAGATPFSGLTGLTTIDHDLIINYVSEMALEPNIAIGGNIVLRNLNMTCEAIDAFVASQKSVAGMVDRDTPLCP